MMRLIPLKLSQDGQFEVGLHTELSVSPGHIWMLRGDDDSFPVYAKVLAMVRLKKSHKYRVRLQALKGVPRFSLNRAEYLDETAVRSELSDLLNPIECPWLVQGKLMGELMHLDTLTLIHGSAHGSSMDILQVGLTSLIESLPESQKVLIVDPHGVFPLGEHDKHMRLSIQQLGVHRFLGLLEPLLPSGLVTEVLSLLGSRIPMTPDFIPFRHLLQHDLYEGNPSQAVLLHLLHRLYEDQLFADQPEQVVSVQNSMKELTQGGARILSLAHIPEYWRAPVYTLLLEEILTCDDPMVFPVLLSPEVYVDDFRRQVIRAGEKGLNLLVATSAHPLQAEVTWLFQESDNSVQVALDGYQGDLKMVVEGAMTLGFPLTCYFREGPDGIQQEEIQQDEIQQEESQYQEIENYHVMAPFASEGVMSQALMPELVVQDPLKPEENATSIELTPYQDFFDEAEATMPPEPGPSTELPEIPPLITRPPDGFSDSTSMRQADLVDTSFDEDEFEFDFGEFAEESPEVPEEPFMPQPLIEMPSESLQAPSMAMSELYQPMETMAESMEYNPEPERPDIYQPEATSDETGYPQIPIENSPEELPPIYPVLDASSGSKNLGFQVGDRVIHEKYGDGVVERLLPMDGRLTLKVLFTSVGKRLMDADAPGLNRQ
ncbi:MAG: hypothetical protein K2X01_09845 [Cyanobacteria bacterium]|nr:hypothetical protein [Cyanobacteriota bacterium]